MLLPKDKAVVRSVGSACRPSPCPEPQGLSTLAFDTASLPVISERTLILPQIGASFSQDGSVVPVALTQPEELGRGGGPHGLHVGGVCLCADSPSMLPCLFGDLTKACACPACLGHEARRCGLSIFRAVDSGPSGEH